MSKQVDLASIAEQAASIGAKLEAGGADEFTAWLGAYIHAEQAASGRTEFSLSELYEAWEDFQQFRKLSHEENQVEKGV